MKNMIRSLVMLLLSTVAMMSKAQVPFLSSHPSAQAVMFLDFDGHTVAGTSWNYDGPIVCGASGLNNSQITEIFNRVAEDYRPFNINITTDSTAFLAAPLTKRMRVIITVTSSWYGSAGGVAFVGSFSWGDDNPCFVFSALLNYNVKNVAEAASHEAGHTLGLFHQSAYDSSCNKISEYNSGTGSGEIGWAPIMGVGYYRNLTLWNNGPNSYGCSNYQSDLDIITSGLNGFGYRTDDHGNDFAGATTVNFSNNQFTSSGIIERNTDADIFKFIMPSFGNFQLDAVPYNVGSSNVGSDLDLQVTLYNSTQTMLDIYNPGTLLSSVVDTVLNPGIYYLKVEGKGNIYAPNYASLGSYSLLAQTVPATVLALRKLELSGSIRNEKHELSWVIDADEAVSKLVLEVSTDGRNFQPLYNAGDNETAYSYHPVYPVSSQYRLNALFENGRQYYSNTISLRAVEGTPQLISSLTYTGISISAPGNYQYLIMDINSRIITKGTLTPGLNNINLPAITAGMYLVKITDNTGQWTYKFMRQ